jgi:putative peptidoglycan lipid II flippase
VAIYGAGLPAFVLQKVLAPLYYAREDTRSPFRFAVWAMFVNAGLAIGLAPLIGWIAAAIGTTVAGWTMLAQLLIGSRAMDDAAEPDARLLRALPRILVSCLAMALVLALAERSLAEAFASPTLRYLALAALVAAGLATYCTAVLATGALRSGDIRAALRRGRG